MLTLTTAKAHCFAGALHSFRSTLWRSYQTSLVMDSVTNELVQKKSNCFGRYYHCCGMPESANVLPPIALRCWLRSRFWLMMQLRQGAFAKLNWTWRWQHLPAVFDHVTATLHLAWKRLILVQYCHSSEVPSSSDWAVGFPGIRDLNLDFKVLSSHQDTHVHLQLHEQLEVGTVHINNKTQRYR